MFAVLAKTCSHGKWRFLHWKTKPGDILAFSSSWPQARPATLFSLSWSLQQLSNSLFQPPTAISSFPGACPQLYLPFLSVRLDALSISSWAEAGAEPCVLLPAVLYPSQHLGCCRTWGAHLPHYQHIHGGTKTVPGVPFAVWD